MTCLPKGHSADNITQISVNALETMAVMKDGTLWRWGGLPEGIVFENPADSANSNDDEEAEETENEEDEDNEKTSSTTPSGASGEDSAGQGFSPGDFVVLKEEQKRAKFPGSQAVFFAPDGPQFGRSVSASYLSEKGNKTSSPKTPKC